MTDWLDSGFVDDRHGMLWRIHRLVRLPIPTRVADLSSHPYVSPNHRVTTKGPASSIQSTYHVVHVEPGCLQPSDLINKSTRRRARPAEQRPLSDVGNANHSDIDI